MMFKLVIARAINSAFLLFIITSDTEQFQADTLSKVTDPHFSVFFPASNLATLPKINR